MDVDHGQLADIVVEDGPSEISRDAIRRRLLIQCNVRGRDLAGFVADARATVEREVKRWRRRMTSG